MGMSSDYQNALDYIYSFVDFSRTHQDNLSPENFDLSRMVRFMEILGSPQDDFPSLHIAGSKGKGSVSAFCSSVLQTAGYKVGLYTSPHLKDFEERIQVDHTPISRGILVEYVEEIKPAAASVPGLTTFEIMTGLAFLFFAREKVDLAVIEVGLGGRLDATNIITPEASVITSLYLDHVSILGDTLDKIAAEKGGIIKPGVPVICSPQEDLALAVLKEIAARNKADLIQAELEYPFEIISKSLDGQAFSLKNSGQTKEFQIPLLGNFQVINAVTAYAVLDSLRSKGFVLDNSAVFTGFKDVNWPARFEVLRRQPPLIIDSAHNPASMGKLRDTLDEYFPDLPLILVFGISEDKQLSEMYQEILPRTSHLICTSADHPRAMDPEALSKKAESYICSRETVPNVGEALTKALELAGSEKLVVVAGSIFVAASARIAWFEKLDDQSQQGFFQL
ncbi:MAG TPA: bifunctional folylpolyglutamate synthase/dihydrofolate synthase [Chloroflexi bacterium]|nr:bifunctional folylpolyglutamate synthase/dihydrofolate synthase [Chloroflexota bacterium]